MPIEPKRVEAAARAIAGFGPGRQYDEEWAEAKRWPYGEMCLTQAENALAAAYPELASDTAWVAPVEATDRMVSAHTNRSPYSRPCDGIPPFTNSRGHFWDEAQNAWDAFCDAHTKEQGGT